MGRGIGNDIGRSADRARGMSLAPAEIAARLTVALANQQPISFRYRHHLALEGTGSVLRWRKDGSIDVAVWPRGQDKPRQVLRLQQRGFLDVCLLSGAAAGDR